MAVRCCRVLYLKKLLCSLETIYHPVTREKPPPLRLIIRSQRIWANATFFLQRISLVVIWAAKEASAPKTTRKYFWQRPIIWKAFGLTWNGFSEEAFLLTKQLLSWNLKPSCSFTAVSSFQFQTKSVLLFSADLYFDVKIWCWGLIYY